MVNCIAPLAGCKRCCQSPANAFLQNRDKPTPPEFALGEDKRLVTTDGLHETYVRGRPVARLTILTVLDTKQRPRACCQQRTRTLKHGKFVTLYVDLYQTQPAAVPRIEAIL